MVLAEEQNSEFPKTFFGGYLFVFVEYFCNRSLKVKTKNIKNCSLILAIVNHRNWLDAVAQPGGGAIAPPISL